MCDCHQTEERANLGSIVLATPVSEKILQGGLVSQARRGLYGGNTDNYLSNDVYTPQINYS